MIEYKLLNNGKGVILTRQPILVRGSLTIEFKGAPIGSTAIFALFDGTSCYRTIAEDGTCSIPVSSLEGEARVTVAQLDESADATWRCEGLKVQPCANGMLVAPNDGDLPQRVVDIAVELHEVRAYVNLLDGRLSALADKLSNMMEGYDLT